MGAELGKFTFVIHFFPFSSLRKDALGKTKVHVVSASDLEQMATTTTKNQQPHKQTNK